MKFSTVFLTAMATHQATAFSPAPINSATKSLTLSAATLEAAPAAADNAADVPAAKEFATMDMGVEKDFAVGDGFVKDSERIQPGRYNDKANSIAIPFLPRPTPLDGSHAGDYGFDPLGFSETFDLYTMQEAEIRHARLAMLAVVGWPMSELLAPDWMLQNGCAPSVLNGVNPLSFLAIAGFLGAAGFFEFKTSLRSNVGTPMGKIHEKDMSAIWEFGVAGDYNWDPLNLYSAAGNDFKGRKGLRDVEISHGRMAMLGITYFAAWEALTGNPIVENSMFFHPNALLPALVAGYAAWSQVYEIGPLNEYPIQVKYTNEGEMKLKRFQNGIADTIEQNAETTEKIQETFNKLDSQFGIMEKVTALPGQINEKVRSTYKYW
jgi:hypothetical protein|eukprot:g8098.t1 g8098   contig27:186378-187894(+)